MYYDKAICHRSGATPSPVVLEEALNSGRHMLGIQRIFVATAPAVLPAEGQAAGPRLAASRVRPFRRPRRSWALKTGSNVGSCQRSYNKGIGKGSGDEDTYWREPSRRSSG